MSEWNDVFYKSSDGLKLYARDYPKEDASLTVLCMHGLTRNSADFGEIAAHLNQRYRVISVDQRGRGRSERDPNPENYVLPRYIEDMWTLLDGLGIDRVALIGTSMGGLMSMLMCAMKPERILGAVINDIGPVIDETGLNRLKTYVGKTRPVRTWEEAAQSIKSLNDAFYPDYTDEDWMAFARRTYRENDGGVPELAYDPAISQGLEGNEDSVPPDLWPVFEKAGQVPMLLVRGTLTDILSKDTAQEMARRHSGLQLVEVERVGHAPFLMESPAREAIDSFLARFE